ncbi:unnamed protein product [Chrysoparadoxa australica]
MTSLYEGAQRGANGDFAMNGVSKGGMHEDEQVPPRGPPGGRTAQECNTRPWLIEDEVLAREVHRIQGLFDAAQDLLGRWLEEKEAEEEVKKAVEEGREPVEVKESKIDGTEVVEAFSLSFQELGWKWVMPMTFWDQHQASKLRELALTVRQESMRKMNGDTESMDYFNAKLVIAHASFGTFIRGDSKQRIDKVLNMLDDCVRMKPDLFQLLITKAYVRESMRELKPDQSIELLKQALADCEKGIKNAELRGLRDNPIMSIPYCVAGLWLCQLYDSGTIQDIPNRITNPVGDLGRRRSNGLLTKFTKMSSQEHYLQPMACYRMAVMVGRDARAHERWGRVGQWAMDWYKKGMECEQKVRRWYPLHLDEATQRVKRAAIESMYGIVDGGGADCIPYEVGGCSNEWCPSAFECELEKCQGCGLTQYCSAECQKAHWLSRHKAEHNPPLPVPDEASQGVSESKHNSATLSRLPLKGHVS